LGAIQTGDLNFLHTAYEVNLVDWPDRVAVPERLRYFLQRDSDLQGAALLVVLRVAEWSNPRGRPVGVATSLHPRFPAKQR
jgi:hypothetical protein